MASATPFENNCCWGIRRCRQSATSQPHPLPPFSKVSHRFLSLSLEHFFVRSREEENNLLHLLFFLSIILSYFIAFLISWRRRGQPLSFIFQQNAKKVISGTTQGVLFFGGTKITILISYWLRELDGNGRKSNICISFFSSRCQKWNIPIKWEAIKSSLLFFSISFGDPWGIVFGLCLIILCRL